MTINPLFSIITVTLNNIDGLRATYDSIDRQTNSNYEWIVIDGGSLDGTANYLGSTDANWISEQDSGIYDAMNKGIDRARGDYLLFLNTGDKLADHDVLKTIAHTISSGRPDFVYGDALENINGALHIKKSRPHQKIQRGMITHHQSMLYRRSALDGHHYDTAYHISADYDLTLRFLRSGVRPCYIPKPLCLFQGGGLSQQKVLLGRSEQFNIRRMAGIPLWKNILIFIGQSGLYTMRKIFPAVYWWLKRH